MSSPEDLEAVFIRDAATISGVENALANEPQKLPKLPAVTMLYTGPEPFDAETGAGWDVTHSWVIRLYVPLSDMVKAQTMLKQLIQGVVGVVRANPRLDDLADIVTIDNDGGGLPMFEPEAGYAVKQLRLHARRTES